MVAAVRYFSLMGVILILSSCVTPGKDFCIGSGYLEDSPQYQQCTSHYSTQRQFYDYCINNQGITQDGPAMKQCISNAISVRQDFNQTMNMCSQRANGKVPSSANITYLEEQAVITPDWKTGTTLIELQKPVPQATLNSLRTQLKNQCMQAYGWYKPGNWQGGKQQLGENAIQTKLSDVFAQKIEYPQPKGNPYKTQLLDAAAKGDMGKIDAALQHVGVNVSNHQGYNAVHFAALNGQTPAVQYLIESKGADFQVKSGEGRSALDLALISKNQYLVDYLLKRIEQAREEEYRANNPHLFVAEWDYVACYSDPYGYGMPNGRLRQNSVSIAMCQAHCQGLGYQIAGLSSGNTCSCGTSLPHYGKLAETSCNIPCAGNAGNICGGNKAVSVWVKSAASTGSIGTPVGTSVASTSDISNGSVDDQLEKEVKKALDRWF